MRFSLFTMFRWVTAIGFFCLPFALRNDPFGLALLCAVACVPRVFFYDGKHSVSWMMILAMGLPLVVPLAIAIPLFIGTGTQRDAWLHVAGTAALYLGMHCCDEEWKEVCRLAHARFFGRGNVL